MPTYRIYYSERDPGTAVDTDRFASTADRLPGLGGSGDPMDETEWEEEVEGSSPMLPSTHSSTSTFATTAN